MLLIEFLSNYSMINELQVLAFFLSFVTHKTVSINPTNFQLAPGESCAITLQFQAPTSANSVLLPIYSGFIYATNTVNGQVVHLSCKYSFLLIHLTGLAMNMYALFLKMLVSLVTMEMHVLLSKIIHHLSRREFIMRRMMLNLDWNINISSTSSYRL